MRDALKLEVARPKSLQCSTLRYRQHVREGRNFVVWYLLLVEGQALKQ